MKLAESKFRDDMILDITQDEVDDSEMDDHHSHPVIDEEIFCIETNASYSLAVHGCGCVVSGEMI